jgi:hypothetical protein
MGSTPSNRIILLPPGECLTHPGYNSNIPLTQGVSTTLVRIPPGGFYNSSTHPTRGFLQLKYSSTGGYYSSSTHPIREFLQGKYSSHIRGFCNSSIHHTRGFYNSSTVLIPLWVSILLPEKHFLLPRQNFSHTE